MKFSYNWLRELSGFKGSAEKMAEVLTLYVAEVDEVKKVGADSVLDVSLPANRVGNLSGHWGLAKEIAIAANLKFNPPAGGQSPKLEENGKKNVSDAISINIENPNDCRRYSARVIEGIKVVPSPKWLQDRLSVLGLRPINIIVDSANFVMLETGQPLHAFDYDKIDQGNRKREFPISNFQFPKKSQIPKTKKIVVRRAKKDEEIETLDGEKYKLDPNILVIADSKNPVAIAGVKGGLHSGIDPETKNIIIESANFDPVVTRNASRQLKLRTDASLRFEHGLHPSMTENALNRISALIQQYAGGVILRGISDVYPKKSSERIAEFDPVFTDELLGDQVPPEKSSFILSSLGFKKMSVSSKGVTPVIVAPEREDVSLREDVAEEIGRLWGYDNVKEKPFEGPHIPEERDEKLYWQEKIRDFLVSFGNTEIQTYSFTNKKILEVFNIAPSERIEIENPVSDEYQYLRPGVAFNVLGIAQKNNDTKGDIRVFEIGTIFAKGKQGISEYDELCLAVNMRVDKSHDSFFTLKGMVDNLFSSLRITDDWIDDVIPKSKLKDWRYQMLHPYRRAEVKVGNELVGLIGELNPKIAKFFEIKGRISIFAASMDVLTRLASEEHEYREFSRFPAVTRDIAFLVPSDVRIEEAASVIESSGGQYLVDVDLFDIYEGPLSSRDSEASEHLELGKKSLAFHLVFQAKDKTLTDGEVDRYMVIIKNAAAKQDWVSR